MWWQDQWACDPALPPWPGPPRASAALSLHRSSRGVLLPQRLPGWLAEGVGQRAGVGDLASPGGTVKTSAAAWANPGGPAPSSGESRWPHFWAPASRW